MNDYCYEFTLDDENGKNIFHFTIPTKTFDPLRFILVPYINIGESIFRLSYLIEDKDFYLKDEKDYAVPEANFKYKLSIDGILELHLILHELKYQATRISDTDIIPTDVVKIFPGKFSNKEIENIEASNLLYKAYETIKMFLEFEKLYAKMENRKMQDYVLTFSVNG